MLSILGFGMMAVFLYLVISKRLSVVVAFIFVAVVFGLIGGFTADMGEMMMNGIIKVEPTVIITMLVGLDGDGSSTFIISVTAMPPLYTKLRISRFVLAGVVGLAAALETKKSSPIVFWFNWILTIAIIVMQALEATEKVFTLNNE